VIQRHLRTHLSSLAHEIRENVYVDNVFLTADTLDEALLKVEKARALFSEARMNLQEFSSNVPGFDDAISPDLLLPGEEPKVLGIKWKKKEDALEFPFPTRAMDVVSRRTVLQTIAGIYDPLGLIAPCTLHAKLYFQTLWSSTRTWDSPVTIDEEARLKSIEESWTGTLVTIPRRTPLHGAVQLHVFVDASKDAYAFLAYLRGTDKRGAVAPTLTFAKCRLKPKKQDLTIPRLELMTLFLGVRLLGSSEPS
jgi:hypothetical protein